MRRLNVHWKSRGRPAMSDDLGVTPTQGRLERALHGGSTTSTNKPGPTVTAWNSEYVLRAWEMCSACRQGRHLMCRDYGCLCCGAGK